MIAKLLCWLGRHKWRNIGTNLLLSDTWQVCGRPDCKGGRILLEYGSAVQKMSPEQVEIMKQKARAHGVQV
jgi:hypothetical protein